MSIKGDDYKILVVDSSLIVIERLNSLLKELKCVSVVSTAYTYEEAIDSMNTNEFDVVLFDTKLRSRSGFELLTFIKENHSATKTIMLTNQVSTFYRNKGEKMGTDHFIDKSSEFEKVAQIINNYSTAFEMN